MKTQHNDLSNKKSYQDRLNRSYQYCRTFMKKKSNFYIGANLSPKQKANAMFSVYVWLSVADDIIDNTTASSEKKLITLSEFKKKTLNDLQNKNNDIENTTEDYMPAFCHTVHSYDIPWSHFEDMISGQTQDLIKKEYDNVDELYHYCQLVASSVGFVLAKIWGYTSTPETHLKIEQLGVAMQLTNILRDIRDDKLVHRRYIPIIGKKADDSISEQEMHQSILMLIEKADYYYKNSASFVDDISSDCRLSFLLIFHTYYAIFKKIKAHPDIILSGLKVKLGIIEKIVLLFSVLIKSYWK